MHPNASIVAIRARLWSDAQHRHVEIHDSSRRSTGYRPGFLQITLQQQLTLLNPFPACLEPTKQALESACAFLDSM